MCIYMYTKSLKEYLCFVYSVTACVFCCLYTSKSTTIIFFKTQFKYPVRTTHTIPATIQHKIRQKKRRIFKEIPNEIDGTMV